MKWILSKAVSFQFVRQNTSLPGRRRGRDATLLQNQLEMLQ